MVLWRRMSRNVKPDWENFQDEQVGFLHAKLCSTFPESPQFIIIVQIFNSGGKI